MPASPHRVLLRFLLTAAALFVVMLLPWPGLRSFHGQAFRAGAELIFQHFGREGVVLFLPASAADAPPPDRDKHKDTVIVCAKRGVPQPLAVWSDSWLTAYLPTIKLIALVLATPIAWPRRWRALFWGLLVVHGLIAARLALILVYTYAQPTPCRLFAPSALVMGVLTWLYHHLALSTMPLFMAPVLVWVLVTIRREDVTTIVGDEPRSQIQSG